MSGGAEEEDVSETWVNLGDDAVDAQIEQRRKALADKLEQERRARAALAQPPSTCGDCTLPGMDSQPAFRILRRPQSSSTLSPSRTVDGKEGSRVRSLEERQAAYQQARERIFGDNYNPDQEPPPLLPQPPAQPSPPFELVRCPALRMPLPSTPLLLADPVFDASRPPPYRVPLAANPPADVYCPPYGRPPSHVMNPHQHFSSMNSSSNPQF